MAKATISMASGATIVLEGTDQEVASLVARLEGTVPKSSGAPAPQTSARQTKRTGNGRVTPVGLISDLIGEGYFAKPRELGAVKQAFEERGHIYPLTHLSPVMLRMVKKRELRRLKQGNRWAYVR